MSTPALPPAATVTGAHTAEGADLRHVFSRSLTRMPGGAQLVVTVDGAPIVDIAGGVAGGPVEQDTVVQVFSVSKLIVALAAVHASGTGALDVEAPLADYWPAFQTPSTRSITARHVLSHSSGINGVDTTLSIDDLLSGALDRAVENQEPRWEPGTAHGYHTFTYGALMAGVFRHGVGTSVQDYAARHIVEPAGGGFWFGAPDDVVARLAQLSFDAPVLTEVQLNGIIEGTSVPDGSMGPIMQNAAGFFGDQRVQQADWPAMSGVSSAQALSRIVNAAHGYGREATVPKEAIQDMAAERFYGKDHSLGQTSGFGSGVELPQPALPYLGPGSYGHQGAGGSVVAIDPGRRLVFSYVQTHTSATVGASDQAITLLAATRALLDRK